jgi:hypothetical protein
MPKAVPEGKWPLPELIFAERRGALANSSCVGEIARLRTAAMVACNSLIGLASANARWQGRERNQLAYFDPAGFACGEMACKTSSPIFAVLTLASPGLAKSRVR